MNRHGAMSDGARIDYSVAGAPTAPTLLFINSIATTRELWARQVSRLSKSFRGISYDARGHGVSPVTAGGYPIEQLGRDALAILDDAGTESAHVCGISLGGITAMWMGVHAPRRVTSLVLANTAARIGSVEMWSERIAFVKQQGMATLADVTMPRWFTEGFRAREPHTIETPHQASMRLAAELWSFEGSVSLERVLACGRPQSRLPSPSLSSSPAVGCTRHARRSRRTFPRWSHRPHPTSRGRSCARSALRRVFDRRR